MNKLRLFIVSIFFLIPMMVFAQRTVNGAVTEQTSGEPLPGVNIQVQGTDQGTTTDFDGNYVLENVNDGSVLEFSYLGYETQSITVTSGTINVSLAESAESLEEVVVIGYGTTTVKDATGSVESITDKEFNKGPIVSADQLITGKVAGVRITSNGGQPDAAPNIRIRGGASLSANNNPLIVIDGIPIDNTNPAGVSNPLNLINPNDIESFSILKDASATAIYGSRASNGVIIITTKKGFSGKVKYNFSMDTSWGQVYNKVDVMDGKEFTGFIQDYFPDLTKYLGVDDPTTEDEDDPSTAEIEGRILSNTNWQDEIYQNAISGNVNFSARGSISDVLPFRVSLGHNRTEGIVRTSDYDRTSLSLKLTPTLIDDHLDVDFNVKALYSDKNAIDEDGALGNAIRMNPTKPLYDENSIFNEFYQDQLATGALSGTWNPLAVLLQRSRPEKVYKILGNVELDYKLHFMPDMRAVLNLGLERSKSDIEEIYTDGAIATYKLSNDSGNYVFNPGTNYSEDQDITNKTLDAYLIYEKDLDGLLHSFDIQGGYSYQNFENDGTKVEYRYNDNTGLREVILDEANPTNRYYNVLNLQSFFGRSNINIADRYLMTLSLRADASSLFNEENRWGYFPAAALAWKLTDEAFLDNSSVFNNLKMRLGWGQTGQQDITGQVGFYPSTPLFVAGSTTSQYLEGVLTYAAISYNPDLTWEKTTTYNAGLDFDLFKSSLVSGSVDVYKRYTNDLLANTDVPPGQALNVAFIQNVGKTENQGFETFLNIKLLNKENFLFNVNGNLAYNYTEVTDLNGLSQIGASESTIRAQSKLARHALGQEAYSAWVFKQVYDEDGNPIPGAFVDLNGDNRISDDDRFFKPLRPNWTYGFGFAIDYYDWNLSSSFRGQLGGFVYNSNKMNLGWKEVVVPINSESLTNTLDFYNDAAYIGYQTMTGNNTFSDYFLEDASFVRVENIVLTKRFNDLLIPNTSFNAYFSVSNPFLFTNYSGLDPENFNAIDNNLYPRPTVYTLGLNFDF